MDTDTNDSKAVDGPFRLLKESVVNSTPVLINLRNNKKLLGHIRAYDRHFNMVLENVQVRTRVLMSVVCVCMCVCVVGE
jgi:small nuclear ribonucleoprotein (snRNP)-like protein